MEIDSHVGCAMSGLVADARTMVEHARTTAQNHAFVYDEDIQVSSVTQAVCDLALRFGESVAGEEAMMSRPFGVALLIAGYDAKGGPQLYHADPSGTSIRYEAKAIGSGQEGAQGELQDKYRKDMSLREAEVLALRLLRQVMEEKLDEKNVQLAVVTPRVPEVGEDGKKMGSGGTGSRPRMKGGFRILEEDEVKTLVAEM